MNASKIFIGGGTAEVYLDPAYANRHGLIAGATGTGKTVSLQVLAEGFLGARRPGRARRRQGRPVRS